MSADKKGIKELREAIKALRVLAVGGAMIAEEGLEMEDIDDAIEIVKKYPVIKEGIKDVKLSIEEAKDLDQLEVVELASLIIAAVNDVKKALAGEKVEL